MGYYEDKENVEAYIRMAAEYDGKLLVEALGQYLPPGAKVLELGMGPGKDLLLLRQVYQVVGSDSSAIFVERFKKLHPNTPALRLDAITIATDEQFQGIYSNKVLHHLTRAELRKSLRRQAQVLAQGGIALHSFWYGDEAGEHRGLHFTYYSEDSIRAQIASEFDILAARQYAEIEPGDSFYLVLRRR